jgi:hypothetical protein
MYRREKHSEEPKGVPSGSSSGNFGWWSQGIVAALYHWSREVSDNETIPTDACQYFYDCRSCGAVLKPLKADCCIFCSYGDTSCPSIQEAHTFVICSLTS